MHFSHRASWIYFFNFWSSTRQPGPQSKVIHHDGRSTVARVVVHPHNIRPPRVFTCEPWPAFATTTAQPSETPPLLATRRGPSSLSCSSPSSLSSSSSLSHGFRDQSRSRTGRCASPRWLHCCWSRASTSPPRSEGVSSVVPVWERVCMPG